MSDLISPPELVRDVYRRAADGMKPTQIFRELRSSHGVVKRILGNDTIGKAPFFCGPVRRCPECGAQVVCHCVECILAAGLGFVDPPAVSVRYWRDPRARVRMGYALYRSLDEAEIYVQFVGKIHASIDCYQQWIPAELVTFEKSILSRNLG